MSQLPESFTAVIADRVDRYPNDVKKATESSYRKIANLPDYEEFVQELVTRAIAECVHELRHRRNVQARNGNGHYANAQARSLKVGESAAVQESHRSVYCYYIAGKQLGDVTGEELPGIAAGERNRASGHLFNARLAEWLQSQGVSGEKKVREVVSEKKLQAHFRSLQEQTDIDAA